MTRHRGMSPFERVFRPLFGRWWPVALPLLPVVVAWPIVVFQDEVAFDAAHFVEEWLKLSVTTLIFYFVIELVQEQRRSELSRLDLADFRLNHLIIPLERAIAEADNLVAQLNPGEATDISDGL